MVGVTRDMNECRIYSNAGENHFMTKRFDRARGKKIHMQSLGAIAHISYKEPALCSYEMAAQYMRELKLSMKEIEQFYSRMVFNCLAVNQDDHVKNISFLMNQMSINQKTRDIQLMDMLEVGKKMGIRKRKCMEIISRISKVVAEFEKYAIEAKIREKTYCDIRKVLDQNKVEIDS